MPGQGNRSLQQIMLQRVANALGPGLLRQVAFVGGNARPPTASQACGL